MFRAIAYSLLDMYEENSQAALDVIGYKIDLDTWLKYNSRKIEKGLIYFSFSDIELCNDQKGSNSLVLSGMLLYKSINPNTYFHHIMDGYLIQYKHEGKYFNMEESIDD
jgi:hypothetical protein